jgi:hypothetical protein
MWVSQIFRRFAIAATDRVDCPAMYSRIIHDSAVCVLAFFTPGDFRDRDLTSFFGVVIFFFTAPPSFPLFTL